MNASTDPFQIIASRFRRGTKAYDLFAASPLIIWYVACLWVSIPDIVHSFHHVGTPLGELRLAFRMLSKIAQFIFGAVVLALLLVRRAPIDGRRDPVARALSMLGSYLSAALIVLPVHRHHDPMLYTASFLIIFGLGFSIFSMAWLGRSFSVMPESRKLVTSGPYSVIRHPLYLGEQITLVGVALQCDSKIALSLVVLQFCCQLYRMNYEERILSSSFPEYEAYMERTDRIVPWLY